jgi:S1-C subfamily serine protease
LTFSRTSAITEVWEDAMFALAVSALMTVPVLAPVPPEPPQDPLAKGYLGIWFSTSGAEVSLTIDRTEPGQAAAKAGLRAGDRVVRVNSLQPQATQQLIDHVCTFRPGAVIEVEVQRGDERKTFKVKLGTRPLDAGINRYPLPPTIPAER